MPIFAAEQENTPIISSDLSIKIPVNEISQSSKMTVSGIANPILPRIELPGILIYSVIATPYAIEKSTGDLYYFPNFKVGYEVPVDQLPSNQLVISYGVQQTNYFEQQLDLNGYELYGWHQAFEYSINTSYIPKMLESNINGVSQSFIKLDSSDKQHMCLYEFEYVITAAAGQTYQGIVDGYLVCANLQGSAVRIPFKSGIKFNVQ